MASVSIGLFQFQIRALSTTVVLLEEQQSRDNGEASSAHLLVAGCAPLGMTKTVIARLGQFAALKGRLIPSASASTVLLEHFGMPIYSLTINGRTHQVDADPEMPLLWVLRDRLRLFGTKYGCGIGVCGACTVLDGRRAIRSCTTTISAAAGRSFTTIEGLSPNGSHPCQRAWIEEDVAQCGFCQAGMIMEAASLLTQNPRPTDSDIDTAFSAHVCRCGTYTRIRRAVHRAAAETSR